MVKTEVTAEDKGDYWAVAFRPKDPDLLERMKAIIPKDYRQWDVNNRQWQIFSDITPLRTEFEKYGVDITIRGHHQDNDHESVEYWRKKYRTMDDTARYLHEEVQRLKDEIDRLEKAVQDVPDAPVPDGWAEELFTAVGKNSARAEAVFKALTKCLHPDTATGDKGLMQQLNNARGNARKK